MVIHREEAGVRAALAVEVNEWGGENERREKMAMSAITACRDLQSVCG
jgi:hypothetical protein